MYSQVLVTGGAGFIGSNLAIAMKRSRPAATVTAFDNLRRRGSELNLPRLREADVRFVHGDVRSPEDLCGVTPAPDLIVECSAEPSAQAGYGGSPDYLIQTNLTGCYNCLEVARRTQAHLLFLSTSRVYPYTLLNRLLTEEDETRFLLHPQQTIPGASERGISEDFPIEGARSLYGMTKLAAELMIQEYGDAYNLRYIIDRCGLVTGPWQMGKADQGVISFWLAAHYFHRPLRYIGFRGSGKQVRDFVHIDDLADLILMQTADFAAHAGHVVNVGGGAAFSLSLLECTKLCSEVTGNTIPVARDPATRPADVRVYLTDCGRLSSYCAWRPKRTALQTVESIFAWIQDHENMVKGVLADS